MFVDIMIRRRATLDESSPDLNSRLVEQFMTVPGFWSAGKAVGGAPFEFGGESATLDLRGALVDGLSGQVLYRARFAGYLSRDIGQSDDFVSLSLNPEKADYARFCSATLPRLIEIFGAYRAAVETDKAVMLADFEVTRVQSQKTGRNVSGRDGVYRIWPVCFIDDLLCRRAFGLSAEAVVARAAPECERAEVLCGGAFLLVTSEVVVGPAALDALSARVMARLDARAAVLRQAV